MSLWVRHHSNVSEASHIWGRQIIHMSEVSLTYERGMSLWVSHHSTVIETSLTCQWDMSYIWVKYLSHISEACHTHQRGIPHMWMRYVSMSETSSCKCQWDISHVSESCHTYDWGSCHISVRHVIHMSQASHMVRHLSHVNDVCLYEWNVTQMHGQWGISHMRETWLWLYLLQSQCTGGLYYPKSVVCFCFVYYVRVWDF